MILAMCHSCLEGQQAQPRFQDRPSGQGRGCGSCRHPRGARQRPATNVDLLPMAMRALRSVIHDRAEREASWQCSPGVTVMCAVDLGQVARSQVVEVVILNLSCSFLGLCYSYKNGMCSGMHVCLYWVRGSAPERKC